MELQIYTSVLDDDTETDEAIQQAQDADGKLQ